MDENPQITIVGKASVLSHRFFSYLSIAEKKEIIGDMKCFAVVIGDVSFAAVIEFTPDNIHVREVGGNFPKQIRVLESYCFGLAKAFGKTGITFCTKRKGVEFIGKRLGYMPYAENEFYKRVA